MNNEVLLNNYINKYYELGLDDLKHEVLLKYYINKYYELGLDDLNYNNLVHHPDITKFKIVQKYKRHTNFLEENYEYPLETIHIMKPKIHINKNKIFDTKTKYYISMIEKLYQIDENESIQKLKFFDGDVYKTILLG